MKTIADIPQPPTEKVITQATSPLDAPNDLAGTVAATDQINLSWTAVQSTKPVSYRVVRNAKTIAETTVPWFADSTVIPTTSYGYFVQAIDDDGRASVPSNFVIITASLAVAPVVPVAVTSGTPTVTAPASPPPPTTKNTNTTKPKTTNTAKTTPAQKPAPTPDTTPAPTPTDTNPTKAPAPPQPPTNTNTSLPATNTNTTPPPTNSNTNTSSPRTPQSYSITVTSSGNFSTTDLTIVAGDSVTFIFTGSGDEVIVQFTPSIGTTIKLDHEFTSKKVTLSTPGTYTFKKQGSSIVGTLTVLAS